MLTYGSVCSGIEAASVAWEPLGWRPAWFAEIDPFPSAVLAHHWPHVPNLGDMTTIRGRIAAGDIAAPDVLVGGTPCQAFSVAGMRKSLADERGQLTLEFVRLADAIDDSRCATGLDRGIVVWENVPGVLNTRDNALGCFLGALAGESSELQPPGRRWTNAGCVLGPKRAVAWRVLDAQYFGVAQRRRRVFVVASARSEFDPAEVLFEREGVRRDSAPSREAWASVAALPANGAGTCGADDNQGKTGQLIPAAGCWWDGGQVSQTLDAVLHKGQTTPDKNRFPAVLQHCHVVHGTQDPCHSDTTAFALGRNNGQENAVCVTGTVTHALNTANNGKGSSEDGTGRGVPTVACGDMAVRRLTPLECERLQDFPDGHTEIPVAKSKRLEADELAYIRQRMPGISEDEARRLAADGPRYKAIGNSMAVTVMRWIGRRIAQQTAANDNHPGTNQR